MIRQLIVSFLILIIIASYSNSQIIYEGSDPKQVALTFDDGPSRSYTRQVLDILKKEKIKATFFVIGSKVAKDPQIVEREASEGHEIGNHTYCHSKLTWINDAKILDEIDMTTKLIKKFTDKDVVYFRPPHGTVTREKRKMIEAAGYKVVLWYVNADDFFHNEWGMRSGDSIARRVLARVHGGDVILMHDMSAQTVDSLPMIIKELKQKGYTFVTMSELVI